MQIGLITPEMVVKENGRDETVDILREWTENKDRVLTENVGVKVQMCLGARV